MKKLALLFILISVVISSAVKTPSTYDEVLIRDNLTVEEDVTIAGTLTSSGQLTIGGSVYTEANIEVEAISGTLNITQAASSYIVDTAGSVATSDVTIIIGCTTGQVLILRNLNATHDVTYIDSATLALGGDITLGDTTDTLTLYCTGAATQIRLSDGAN